MLIALETPSSSTSEDIPLGQERPVVYVSRGAVREYGFGTIRG